MLKTAARVAIGQGPLQAERQHPRVLRCIDEVAAAVRDARQDSCRPAATSIARSPTGSASGWTPPSQALVDADVAALHADLERSPRWTRARRATPVPVLPTTPCSGWPPGTCPRCGALESVRALLDAVDVERTDEAQPVMPMATISVTEDMATAMRLHAMGWKSVYHHENLAHGLAPEDLGTMLQQRLRWAQGTLQVMLKENPLVQKGLSVGQRLMYFATMWSCLSGFFALAYIAAPIFFLCFDVRPVISYGPDFLIRLVPYLVVNQLLFLAIGYGKRTWRGTQFSLALFPLWIRATWTAVANVVFHRPLGFVVLPKTSRSRRGRRGG